MKLKVIIIDDVGAIKTLDQLRRHKVERDAAEKLTQCVSDATDSLNSFSKSIGELRERFERFRKEHDKDITEKRS